jgi:hypothetical protein
MTETHYPEDEALDPAKIAALRASLIGKKVTIAQAAAAFRVTERAIYQAIDLQKIPFSKVFGARYLEPDDLRRALVQSQNEAPRGRGRPRKVA